MAYGVVRTDRMYGTDVCAGLVSVKYMGSDGSTATEIQNGSVVKLGDLIDREVFTGTDVAANDELKDVVLIATPEVDYDERKRNLDQYINEAGRVARGYHFHTNDVFSVTKDALDGKATPAKGDIVELKAGTKMNVVASATSGSTVIGKIIEVEETYRYKYYVIRVTA